MLKKIFKHLRYRLTRAKTYVGVAMAGLSSAIVYLEGDEKRYCGIALAILAFLFSVIGGDKNGITPKP